MKHAELLRDAAKAYVAQTQPTPEADSDREGYSLFVRELKSESLKSESVSLLRMLRG